MEKSFTRDDTHAMKGIAVIMLLISHLWPFMDRHPVGFAWTAPFGLFDPRWIELVGWACHITLYVFLFLGGYGLWHQVKGGKKLHDILIGLYRNYWRVFVVMIPVAFLFFGNQPTDFLEKTSLCNIYSDFTPHDLVMNLLGIDFSFNREWWFITAYAASMVTGYLLILGTGRVRSFWADCGIVLGLGMAVDVFGYLAGHVPAFMVLDGSLLFRNLIANTNMIPFWMGIVMAKHNGLAVMRGILEKYSKPVRAVLALLGIFMIFVFRQSEFTSYNVDVIIAPIFVVLCMTLVDLAQPVKKALGYIGKHCNNIWLVHSFYCYYFYAATKLVYCTTDALLSLLILLGLSLATSMLINLFYDKLKKLIGGT